MKTPRLCISQKFYDSLVQRLRDTLPTETANEIILMVNAFAEKGVETTDFSKCSEMAAAFFRFILCDLRKARERSQRCREAAARRNASFLNFPSTTPATNDKPAPYPLSRRERRVLEKDSRKNRRAYGPSPKPIAPAPKKKNESAGITTPDI